MNVQFSTEWSSSQALFNDIEVQTLRQLGQNSAQMVMDDGDASEDGPHGPPASVGSEKKLKFRHREFRKRADDACCFFLF
jgi:hypothetical protein